MDYTQQMKEADARSSEFFKAQRMAAARQQTEYFWFALAGFVLWAVTKK